jgi:pimeloyl-ACP methyl ester carboxylesterase
MTALSHSSFAQSGFTVAGAGTPVVLLHSTFSHKGQWTALAENLAKRFQIVAIDLIGHGDTPVRGDRVTLSDEARAVESVLCSLYGRIPAFHLVGHSYGGAIALRLARDNPHKTKTVALFEPTSFHVLPFDDPAREDIASVAAVMKTALKSGVPHAAAEVFIDYWTEISSYSQMPEHRRAMFARMVPTALENFRALMEEPATLDDYVRVAAPVCLITGTTSPESSRRVSEALATALPSAQLFRVAGGHMAPVTNAAPVNSIIERFLVAHELEPRLFGKAA